MSRSSDVPVEVKEFFQNFYKISDEPESTEEYVGSFQSDATFIVASKSARGSEAILEFRKSMWTKVATRKHTLHHIWNHGQDDLKYMTHGTVEFELKDGQKAKKEWAARAELVKGSDGKLQYALYQVYMDTA